MDASDRLAAAESAAKHGLTEDDAARILDTFESMRATSAPGVAARLKLPLKKVRAVLMSTSLFQITRGAIGKRIGPQRRWLHRPALTSFSVDLMDITAFVRKFTDQYKKLYLLTMIDHGSRYLVAVPITQKNQVTTIAAMERAMRMWPEELPDGRKTVVSDAGNEFGKGWQDEMRDLYGLVHYESQSRKKAAIAERAHGSIRKLWAQAMMRTDAGDPLAALNTAIHAYNHRKHAYFRRQLSPAGAITLDDSELSMLMEDWQPARDPPAAPPQLHVGQKVRVQRERPVFAHADADATLWSDKVFTVAEVVTRDGVHLYQLKDVGGKCYKDWLERHHLMPVAN